MSVSTIQTSIRRLLAGGTRRLAATGIPNAQQEAEWLLSALLGVSRMSLYLDMGTVPEAMAAQFDAQIEARGEGMPLPYLLGHAEFYGQRFAVAPGVFIPRPETEAVVEAAIEALEEKAAGHSRPLCLLEFGTGSGCILVTLARCLPTCLIVGIELSWEALCMTSLNAQRQGCSTRTRLVQGDWGTGIYGTFDGIVANPPYIPTAQVNQLPRDVRREPRLSLDGGQDGMRDLFQLVAQAERLLAPRGLLALECGEDQAEALRRHVRSRPWAGSTRIIDDLAGRPRGVLTVRKDGSADH